MDNSIERPGEQPKYAGEVHISDQERAFLAQAISGHFEKHPTLDGIEIIQLKPENVPVDILRVIQEVHGRVTTFAVIKIAKEVPLHQHPKDKDGEVYFGGDNGTVTLFDSFKTEKGRFDLKEDSYTRIVPGEWHQVQSSDGRGSVFFGVKFEI